jgi:hypothetical protein
VISLAWGFAGCITTPLEKRDWHAIRTAHYEVVSSIGVDQTERIATELERFRGAVAYVWGIALPDQPMRTRVYAFDDRSMPRKFAYQYQRSFLIPRLSSDVIVLRTGGTWEEDAWTELKLDYARRLMWNASPDVLPPWLEEGLPQLASTIAIGGKGAIVGSVRDEHVHTLRESKWIPFDRLLSRSWRPSPGRSATTCCSARGDRTRWESSSRSFETCCARARRPKRLRGSRSAARPRMPSTAT